MGLRENERDGLNNLVSHLLNCIFCSNEMLDVMNENNYNEKEDVEVLISKKKKKKFEKEREEKEEEIVIGVRSSKFSIIKPAELWEIVRKISEIRYGHKLNDEGINSLSCFQTRFDKMAVLRDLSICLGLVLEKNEYFDRH